MFHRTPVTTEPGGPDRTMFRSSRHRVAAVALLVSVAAGPAAVWAQGVPSAAETAVPIVRIEGRGHGHGVGLSQWGAHTMATQGASAAEILSTFYPGTGLGRAGGEITVRVDARSVVHVSFPDGGEIRAGRDGGDVVGFPVRAAPGEVVTVRSGPDGVQVGGVVVGQSGSGVMMPAQTGCLIPGLCPTTTTTTQPEDPRADPGTDPDGDPDDDIPGDGDDSIPGTSAPAESGPPTSPGPVWAVPDAGGTVTSVDRRRNYRGVLRIGGDGAVTNHVDVEDYLRGMIEVPGHWPPAAVQAQTIAARTFALRAMATSGSICDTDACQVYLGTERESPGLDAAVAATAGTVVTYGDGLAATFFSASAGGVSATPREGFGNDTEVPYLQAVEHPDADPQPWTVDVPLSEVGARFGYPGTVSEIRIDETGPSGRPVRMTIDGDRGPRPVEPKAFESQLDLRSTLFTVDNMMSDGRPIEPPPSTPPTTREALAGVQTPAVGDPILFAVPPPSTTAEVDWPWPAAAAASIASVTAVGILGLRRRPFVGGTPRKEQSRQRSGRVDAWRRRPPN